MELEGAKKCFAYLSSVGLRICVFTSDRHLGIAKWIRENQTGTKHFYDIWHVAKSITKKLFKASKCTGYGIIGDWTKAIRTHLYWCALSTKQGFEQMILAKWQSFMRHVSNKYENPLYPKCAHGIIHPRKWIKIGTEIYLL